MVEIYCGNNARNKNLVLGRARLGTRYGCLRKGIGAGLSMERDPDYIGEYYPIDKTRIYCGNQRRLPTGYDRLGSLPQCLQKGVGIGKRIRAGFKGIFKSDFATDLAIFLVFYIFISSLVFVILYRMKPDRVTETNSSGKKVIIWKKFTRVYVLLLVVNIFLVGMAMFYFNL